MEGVVQMSQNMVIFHFWPLAKKKIFLATCQNVLDVLRSCFLGFGQFPQCWKVAKIGREVFKSSKNGLKLLF
jgi:hypothetical protein